MLEEGVSAKGATIYTTLSCCLQCAKQLVGAKVKRVVYLEEYRDKTGLEYLSRYGVKVEKFEEENKECSCIEPYLRCNAHDNKQDCC